MGYFAGTVAREQFFQNSIISFDRKKNNNHMTFI